MKLFGAIAIYVAAEDILRAPRFFDKIKRAFGGKPDLRTGRVRGGDVGTDTDSGGGGWWDDGGGFDGGDFGGFD